MVQKNYLYLKAMARNDIHKNYVYSRNQLIRHPQGADFVRIIRYDELGVYFNTGCVKFIRGRLYELSGVPNYSGVELTDLYCTCNELVSSNCLYKLHNLP